MSELVWTFVSSANCGLSAVRYLIIFFFKQKTAYEMRISDWSSDVCSSDLHCRPQCADHRFRNGGKHRSGSIAVGHAAQDLDSDLELAVVCPAARDVERVLEIPGLLQHSIEARRERSIIGDRCEEKIGRAHV